MKCAIDLYKLRMSASTKQSIYTEVGQTLSLFKSMCEKEEEEVLQLRLVRGQGVKVRHGKPSSDFFCVFLGLRVKITCSIIYMRNLRKYKGAPVILAHFIEANRQTMHIFKEASKFPA